MGLVLTPSTPELLITPYGTESQQGQVRFGPWTFGSNKYFVINDTAAASGNNTFFINKRTGPGTWVSFGDGGITSDWYVGQIFQVTADTRYIYIITNDLDRIPGNYWLHKWDTTTDTMAHTDTGIAVSQAVEGGVGDANATIQTLSGLIFDNSGNLWFAFPSDVELIAGKNYARTSYSISTDNGATWSASALFPHQATVAESFGCYGIINGASNRVRFSILSCTTDNSVSPTQFNLNTLCWNGASFGALQQLTTDLTIYLGEWLTYGPQQLPIAFVNGGTTRLAVPFVGGNAGAGGPPASGSHSPGPALANYVAIADDTADDPTWTIVQFDATTQIWGFQWTLETLIMSVFFESYLVLIWCTPTSFDATVGRLGDSGWANAGTVYYSASADNGATWQAPAVLLTYTTPDVPSGLTPGDVAGEMVLYLANANKFNLGGSIDIPNSLHHYYITLTAPTISIACPVAPTTATVGVPYTSDAPVVTGGTAPFTFSLTAAPGWMSINSSTGVVSGTPDASGSVTYTIEVTDSSSPPLSASVPAPCPLTVGAAALPCENITPQPSTDVQFKLIKVLATMAPAKRLPTRGSVQ